MNKEAISAIAAFVLGFGLISRKLEKSILTPPMAYVGFGLLISSSAIGLIPQIDVANESIKALAEITLAVLLFTDASRIQIKLLRKEYNLPLRLLGIGLPLTIIIGTALALVLFPQFHLWEAAILATILAPTDAALGQAVVNNSDVPASIRQGINIESGLNDGICLPILLLFVSLAVQGKQDTSATYWLSFTLQQIVFGTVVGIAIGYFGCKLIANSVKHKWITISFEDLSILGLSILAYAGAEMIGGNGFIAAFTGGFVLGYVAPKSVLKCLHEFGEAEGQLLTLISFLLFGAIMVFPSLSKVNWQIGLYAVASLTFTRMLGMAIATVGLKLQWDSTVFIGWFGPRGIASIVYGLLIVEKESLANSELMFNTMVITVFISVFAHGLTAFPGAKIYAKSINNKKDYNKEMHEKMPVKELPVRLPWRQ